MKKKITNFIYSHFIWLATSKLISNLDLLLMKKSLGALSIYTAKDIAKGIRLIKAVKMIAPELYSVHDSKKDWSIK